MEIERELEPEPQTERAKPPEGRALITVGSRGLQLVSLDDYWRFSVAVVKSGLAPRQLDTTEKVLIVIQCGAEVGLSPMQSLKSIYVINNVPTLFGDALPALAWSSGLLETFEEWYECGDCPECSGSGRAQKDGRCRLCRGSGRKRVEVIPENPSDEFTAVCLTRRKGQVDGRLTRFSIADAKRAGLWGKRTEKGGLTPWVLYWPRMLVWRARSWNFRDNLADVLRGMSVKEEVEDYTPVEPEIAFDAHGNSVEMLRRRLDSCGCKSDDDRHILVRWASLEKSNGLPKYGTFDECITDPQGAVFVLNVLQQKSRRVPWADMLQEARFRED